MKVNHLNKCFVKHIDGTWSWSVNVWHTESTFCDYTIHGRRDDFANEEYAVKDMERALKFLKIKV
jgi:hypothetical protein